MYFLLSKLLSIGNVRSKTFVYYRGFSIICQKISGFCLKNPLQNVKKGQLFIFFIKGNLMQERQSLRPSRDEYFMEVCRAIAKRATCDRGRSGCVIARDHQILVTGYV